MSEITYTPSPATIAAIAQCVEARIAREYRRDSLPLAAALEAAEAGVYADAREAFQRFTGGDERGLNGWVNGEVQILMNAGLVARECQCRRLGSGRLSRNHRQHADLDVCHRHYEADVPLLAGLLLCGDCHVAEWEAGTR
jgi:hypothetical protein